MDLSDGELAALRNLSRKKLGLDVDWITISDARALTDFGLARRDRGGWQITTQGEAALHAAHDDVDAQVEGQNIISMTMPARPPLNPSSRRPSPTPA
ncbi:MAG: hypothetical protein ACYC8V_05215 [Caulobacteraceae bacterium]